MKIIFPSTYSKPSNHDNDDDDDDEGDKNSKIKLFFVFPDVCLNDDFIRFFMSQPVVMAAVSLAFMSPFYFYAKYEVYVKEVQSMAVCMNYLVHFILNMNDYDIRIARKQRIFFLHKNT